MATIQDLESALVQAHQAGDGRSAQILADEIRWAKRLQNISPGTRKTGYLSGMRSEVVDPPEPNPIARLGRGFKDFGVAVQQWMLPKDEAKELTRQQDKEIATYEKGRGPDAGIDLLRLVGSSLPMVPVAGGMNSAVQGALGVMRTAGPVVRAAVGATEGVTQGALTYTPEGGSKGTQMVMGAGAGALAPFLTDAVSSVVARATQFGKEAAARFGAKPEAIIAELEPVLAKHGVRWGDLSQEVRDGMLMQARRQLTVSGELAPDALARKLEMDELLGPGAGPTQGQVTRNPAQWSWERNTQKLQDIGGPITERFQAQLQRLRDIANDAIVRSGGRARNDFQAGASATGAVQQKMADSKKVVDDLYDVWRETGAGGTEVRPQGIADAIGKINEEIGIENVPPVVRARLESFGMGGGKQTKLLTIDEAEKLRKLIGNNDPGHGPQSLALKRLRQSVDEAVMDTDAPDIPSLKAARGAARERFKMRDSAKGVTAAAQDDAPDRFFQRYVVNGDVRDLRGLKATLTTGFRGGEAPAAGLQAWKDLKGRVIEQAVEKATVKDGAFSGPMFRKALKEIGEERLKVMFEPDELAQLAKLDRVAFGLTAEPNLAAVNHSNTASTGAQFLRDAGRAIPRLAEAATNIPFIGKIGAGAWSAGDDLARNAEMKRRVGTALMGDAFDPTMATDKRRQLAQLLSGKLAPFGVAGGVGFAESNPWAGTQ